MATLTFTPAHDAPRRRTARPAIARPALARPGVDRLALRQPMMALTEALLDVAARGVSFATPGHRCGRSVTPEP